MAKNKQKSQRHKQPEYKGQIRTMSYRAEKYQEWSTSNPDRKTLYQAYERGGENNIWTWYDDGTVTREVTRRVDNEGTTMVLYIEVVSSKIAWNIQDFHMKVEPKKAV